MLIVIFLASSNSNTDSKHCRWRHWFFIWFGPRLIPWKLFSLLLSSELNYNRCLFRFIYMFTSVNNKKSWMFTIIILFIFTLTLATLFLINDEFYFMRNINYNNFEIQIVNFFTKFLMINGFEMTAPALNCGCFKVKTFLVIY